MTQYEERQAAVFDFDGVIFHKETRWKVINPRAGVLGSGMHWTKACKVYENIVDASPGTALNDVFHLDEYSFRYEIPQNITNRMPMDSVNQTARSHAARRRDVLILSGRYYPGLDRFLDGLYQTFHRELRPGELPVPKDPFENSRPIFPDQAMPVSELNVEKSIHRKMELLKSLLHRCEEEEHVSVDTDCEEPFCRYDRLFLYYTEPQFFEYIHEFLRNEMDELCGGRNAIVPFLITGEPTPGR